MLLLLLLSARAGARFQRERNNLHMMRDSGRSAVCAIVTVGRTYLPTYLPTYLSRQDERRNPETASSWLLARRMRARAGKDNIVSASGHEDMQRAAACCC